MIKKIENKKGFTLIELLVVIAIIGILSSIVIASLSTAREKARITKTVSDLRMIRDALEIFYSENGRYPATTGWNGEATCYGGTSGANWIPELVSSGLIKLPLPQSPNYTGSCANGMFIYISDGNNYKLLSHNDSDTPLLPTQYQILKDPLRFTRAFGYWSSDTAGTTW